MAVATTKFKDTDIVWTDITNPTREELEKVGNEYDLNPYTFMDSLDPDHLPKYEEHNNTHFFIVRVLEHSQEHEQTIREMTTKIAVFYNTNFIITIHRKAQPVMESIRETCIDSGKVTSAGAMAVKIIWETLHTYEAPVFKLSEEIDYYESKVFLKKNVPADMIEGMYYLKRKAGLCKKLFLLTNEVLNSVKIEEKDKPALQDARDLHLKLLTLYDQVHDDANNLLNIYLSLSARKTNDVMKILTIFSVFFMPLTFIAGIYGMNFKFMPELEEKWGYPSALLAMGIVSVVIFVWFRRKKWL